MHYVLRSINLLVLFGIRKMSTAVEVSILAIKRVTKVTSNYRGM
jgi:hypothetical protein